jgi:hypothetical protein
MHDKPSQIEKVPLHRSPGTNKTCQGHHATRTGTQSIGSVQLILVTILRPPSMRLILTTAQCGREIEAQNERKVLWRVKAISRLQNQYQCGFCAKNIAVQVEHGVYVNRPIKIHDSPNLEA